MPSVHETAYPRLKATVSPRDLTEVYTPTDAEVDLAQRIARGRTAKVCFLVLLKTFQRLGYFTQLRDVPPVITEHISRCLVEEVIALDPAAYDESGTRRRHISTIRKHLKVKAFDEDGRDLLSAVVREAATTKEDLVDIINVAIEEIVRKHFELPGFTTLFEEAQRGRAEVNRTLYERVTRALGCEGKLLIEALLTVDEATGFTSWNAIKEDSGPATLSRFRELVRRLHWLRTQNCGVEALASIPTVKIQHFAAEARSLDAARMQEMRPQKRFTLAAALIGSQVARVLDDLGDMFIKRMSKIRQRGKEALEDYRKHQQDRTDELIAILHDLVIAVRQDGSAAKRISAMDNVVGDQAETILEDCKAHAAYANDNYSSLLWRFYKSHRKALFDLLEEIELKSTSQDTAVESALRFLREHGSSKREWIELDTEKVLDLAWIPEKWWKLVTGLASRSTMPTRVDRRQFEVCLFSQTVRELKAGDLCIEGSDQFADYRNQLVSWEEYERTVESYGTQVGLPVESSAFVARLREHLESTAKRTDERFLVNDSVRLVNGEPVLRKLTKREKPKDLKQLVQLIAGRIEPVNILDVLADTDNWLGWTRFFSPVSGNDAKIESARARYVAATFCYGCNLGPTQTARCLDGFDRRQIAWVNQRHVTDEKIDEAIASLVNAYNRFVLPRLWGSGKSASADGTKWDLYEQNLLSEYHVRYGGYGGIGYYHVSDTYIALFSHFIACGVWEAVYILDGLMKNQSDIQPDTVHSDTQGQSATVFGLAHLLGINLMPRIRNWKDLTLYRPTRSARYDHIDSLFSTEVVDWQLIETHLPDMLRVALSIRSGRITSSTILRKLGNYSRKNRLFQAFRELGRVLRTSFLLRYISDLELRRVIVAATNKSETFNRFVQWILFGGEGLIAENDRDRQRRIIKYNHLVANCLIFHNVYAQTRILHDLVAEGHVFDDETISRLSPYITEHVNRFGTYTLDFNRGAAAPDYSLSPLPKLIETP